MDGNGLNANDLNGLQSSDLDLEVKLAFVETLTQLREVWFVSTPRVGRQIVGVLSGLGTSETMFNRSLPIMTTSPIFERLPRDPRLIAQDLKASTGLADLRDVAQLWLQLLRKWRASPYGIEYRFFWPSTRPWEEIKFLIARARRHGCRKKMMSGMDVPQMTASSRTKE